MTTNPDYESLVITLSFNEKVGLFFGNTPRPVPTGFIYSTLNLALDDILKCAEPGSNHLAFPRAMCLMVAIDLLAKMHAGSDHQGEVKKRFIAFTEFALQGTTFGADIGEKIFAFRCALHHSYRMPTEWKPKGSTAKIPWRFRLVEDRSDQRLTWEAKDGCTFINLYRLHDEVKAGVIRFQSYVSTLSDLCYQQKFHAMFDKYGWLYVGE